MSERIRIIYVNGTTMNDHERIEQIMGAFDDPNPNVATDLFDLLDYLHGHTEASRIWHLACLEYDRQHGVEMVEANA